MNGALSLSGRKFCRVIPCIFLLGVCGAVCYLRHSLCALPVRIFVDTTISAEHAHKIRTWIGQQSTIDDIYTQLPSIFPVVSSLYIRRFGLGANSIRLMSAKPHVRINQDEVLIDGGVRLPANVYTSVCVQELPCIQTVRGAEEIHCPSDVLRQFTDFVDRFDLVWCDQTKIYMRDRQYSQWVLLTNVQHPPHEALVERYRRVVQAELSKSARSRLNKNQWLVDMRFADQAIVYRHPQEESHEKA